MNSFDVGQEQAAARVGEADPQETKPWLEHGSPSLRATDSALRGGSAARQRRPRVDQ